jgi:hypothetical protein
MKTKPNVETLAQCFARLSAKNFRNLQRNARRKDVRIACGKEAAIWADEIDGKAVC